MSTRPRILIAAPAEEMPIAEHLCNELTAQAGCVMWPHGTLGLAGTTLGRFLGIVKEFDMAILVLCATDLTRRQGRGRKTRRDSVLFEVGLFVGAMGGKRVYVVYDRDTSLDLPTDLAGVSTAGFTRRIRGNLKSALEPACFRIKRVLATLQRMDAGPASQAPPSSSAWTFLNKLSTELAAVGADASSQAERMRRRGRPSDDPPPSRTLPGPAPGERDLRFLEGLWKDPETRSVACARVHEGQLRFIYSLDGASELTGDCYDWRLNDGTVTGRFRRSDKTGWGYVCFSVESRDRLSGGFWDAREVPEHLVDSLPDVEGMHGITWIRQPATAPVPFWAERYFRKLRVERTVRR